MPDTSTINVNTIILAITTLVTAMTPIMLAIINRRQRLDAIEIAERVEKARVELRTRLTEHGDQLTEIHTAVNSERTAMIQKLEEMHQAIQVLTADKAALQQKLLDHDKMSGYVPPKQ